MISVKDAKREILPDLDFVRPESRLSEVFEAFKFHTVTRALFVVNPEFKLIGMIEAKTLLKLLTSSDPDLQYREAQEIMSRPLSIPEDELLEKALRLMVESKAEDLAVIDSTGKVVGGLSCFDVIYRLGRF